MNNDLAEETISRIEQALEEEQSTAINEIVQIIQELAAKAFSISVSELSQLIGRDPTITEKVISASNTLGFNPSGMPITTITEAIHTVGFEKIRNLAISILLVENAGHRLNSYEHREMAAISVCSGLMAQNLIQKLPNKIDPELAFVCASLRNYGKLLMTTFLIEQYRDAKSLAMRIGDEKEAFYQIFGLTPLELGQRLLQSTSLPKAIMTSLKPVPKDLMAREAERPEEQILIVSELSMQLCERSFDESVEPDHFNDAIREVLRKFSQSISIELETVNQALVEIDMDLQIFNRAVGMSDMSSPSSQKIRARVSGEHLPARPSDAQITKTPRAKTFAELSEEEREEHAEEQHEKAIRRISEMTSPGSVVDLNEVYAAIVQAIQIGLDLKSCMVFLQEDFDPSNYSARYGCGLLFNKIKNRPLISTKNKDVFSISIARKEDILIQDINAGKIKSVIPEWISIFSNTNSFIVLPVASGDEVFAIILGTLSTGKSISLSNRDLARLKQLRAHLSELKELIEEHTITVGQK